MPIRLTWDDETIGITEYRVYKDTSTINTGSPPAVLATIPKGQATHYIDLDIVESTTYYYRVSFIGIGIAETFSDEIVFVGETFNPSTLIATDNAVWIEATEVSRIFDSTMTALTDLSQAASSDGILISKVDNLSEAIGGSLTAASNGFPSLVYDSKHAFITFKGINDNLVLNNTSVISNKDYGLVAISGRNFEAYFDGVGNDTGVIDWLFKLGDNGISFESTAIGANQFSVHFERTGTSHSINARFPEMKPLLIHYRFIDGEFDVYTSDGAGGLTTLANITGGTPLASNTLADLRIGGRDPTNVNDLESKIMALKSFMVIGRDTAFTTQEITDLANYLLNELEEIL